MTRPVQFTFIEVTAALRYLRASREGIHIDVTLLEEKWRTHGDHGNGATAGALMVLNTEIKLLDDAIHKLWEAIM